MTISVSPLAKTRNKLSNAFADTFDVPNNLLELLPCCAANDGYISSDDDEAVDATASRLSYVGQAAYEVLRKKHPRQHHQLWNVTTGTVIGELQYTPLNCWHTTKDLEDGHDDWFPEKLAEIIKRTTTWCDIMSLGPPDGLFVEKFREAIEVLASRTEKLGTPIVVRIMFGNIVGMPVNCTVVMQELTKNLIHNNNHQLKLWVGAWRKGTSWNHAKIIAVDGKYLWTGGHNWWDYHYLKHNPVHDLSLEMEGRVANDGHLFANAQWAYVQRKQMTCVGGCTDVIPDAVPTFLQSRVTVCEFPVGIAPTFPPLYIASGLMLPPPPPSDDGIPIVSLGRYGAVNRRHKPSDDAIVAMLKSAKKIVRLALQDLGPVCIPGTKITLPGFCWPKEYLDTLGRLLWKSEVDIEILLSNPNSIPGGLTPTEANYGNGWSCNDVSSEIVKTIVKQFPKAKHWALRKKARDNLRVCFIRVALGSTWEDGTNIGMHAKHFIIDDRTAYVGSQNLYTCDLAEWGVVIDDKQQVQKMMEEYWNPMWQVSYRGCDVDTAAVMDGLDIDRGAPHPFMLSAEDRKRIDNQSFRYSEFAPAQSDYYDNGPTDPFA